MKNGHQEFLEQSLTFGIGKSIIFILCNRSKPRMFELWSMYYKANIYTEYLDIYLIFS